MPNQPITGTGMRRVESPINVFQDGDIGNTITQEQIDEIKQYMEMQSDLGKAQREAEINVIGGDFDKNLEKYQQRLGRFAYQAPRMDIFDLASELGAGLLSTPNIGGASAYTGLGVGFNRVSQRLKKEDADFRKQQQQIGMQAMQLAMQDEQRASDFINQRAIAGIKAAQKKPEFVTFEFDVIDEETGEVTRTTKSFHNTSDNLDEIKTILNKKNGVKVSDGQTNINMPDPNASYATRKAYDEISDSSNLYRQKAEAARDVIDQVNQAYILALQVKEAGGTFGPLTAASLRIRELISEIGLGSILDAPDAIAPQKALNQLSMGFTMAIVSQTKGAISDREMKLFIQASPTLGSTFEGYMTQLKMLEKLSKRDEIFYQEYLGEMERLENDGVFGKKQKIALDKFSSTWSSKNPLLTPDEEKILQDAIDGNDQFGGSIDKGFIPADFKSLFNEIQEENRRLEANLPIVSTQQDYDKLESGDQYIDSNGDIREKT